MKDKKYTLLQLKSFTARRRDITGLVFGKLTVVSFNSRRKKHSLWNCTCECGNTSVTSIVNLQTGRTKSCGCEQGAFKHGFARTGKRQDEYVIYLGMKSRCFLKSNPNYPHYGGRGITVCDRWMEPKGVGFMNFVRDMGPRPSRKYSIERQDNDGNYSPGNCVWATVIEQASNKRTNRKVVDKVTGSVYPTMASAARTLGIPNLRDMLIGKTTNITTFRLL